MSLEGARADRRGEPRVAFDGAVRLRYRLFQKFLEENAANISTGGMFIRTIHPGEPGTELDFEFRLDDDFPLIQGRGEVAWVRRGSEEPGKQPGMGIRFVDLPEDSRALVDKIVAERVAAGLELFDLARQAPAVPAAAPAAPPAAPPADPKPPPREPRRVAYVPPDPGEPATTVSPAPQPPAAPVPGTPGAVPAGSDATGRASPLRLVAVAVVSALIGAGAVLSFYWLYVEPSIEALESRIDELAGRPGGPWQPPRAEPEPRAGAARPPESAAAGAAKSGAAPSPAAATDQVAEVTAALRGWAAAWSEQRVEDYLGYYAAAFVPPDGQTRAAWEEARRARLERPRWIRVALTLVQVEPQGPDAAVARFVQSYRAERYQDLVKKRTRLVREAGGWKIAEERVAG